MLTLNLVNLFMKSFSLFSIFNLVCCWVNSLVPKFNTVLVRTWNNVAILKVEVVMRSVNVTRYHRGELASVLLRVTPIHHVDHSLGVAVPKVGVVRRAVVYHGLIDRIGRFVRKNACGETRDNFLDSSLVAGVKDVVVDEHVLAKKVQVGAHIVEQSTNLRKKIEQAF